MSSIIIAKRVQKVIMSGSADEIYSIKFNNLEDGKPNGDLGLATAHPIWAFVKNPPTVNEIVYVLREIKDIHGNYRNYYFPPLAVNKSINHNAAPNELNNDELEAEVETGLDYFKEIENIRPLQPYLGDIIYEGRYGQSLRFGSTISGSSIINNWSDEGEPGTPITIIRNGQTDDPQKASFEYILEDINGDDSSIYLCSNQQLTHFQKAGISPSNHPASYKHMK